MKKTEESAKKLVKSPKPPSRVASAPIKETAYNVIRIDNKSISKPKNFADTIKEDSSSEDKASEVFSMLEHNNIIIVNKAPIRTFFTNFPESLNNLVDVSKQLKKIFKSDQEIIFQAEEDSKRYLSFCIRQSEYDEDFNTSIAKLKEYVFNLLDLNKEAFNILIYTDYKKYNSIDNVK